MLDAREKFAVVLEDDAIFDDKFVIAATEVLANAPPGWDFINIGEGCDDDPDLIGQNVRPGSEVT